MSVFASVQESVLYGADDISFAALPVDSMYPPPFVAAGASGGAVDFSNWRAECEKNKRRLADSSKRYFHGRAALPPMKSIEQLDVFPDAAADEPLVATRDAALIRKRVVLRAELARFSARRACELERRANRYHRLHYESGVFTQCSAMLMCELMCMERALHPQKSDWFALQPAELKHYRPQDLAMIYVDLSGGASGVAEYFHAHRKRGKALIGVTWNARLVDASFDAGGHASTIDAHLFDTDACDVLAAQIARHSALGCVPFVFADGCAPLTAAPAQELADSLQRDAPSDAEVAARRAVGACVHRVRREAASSVAMSVESLDTLPAQTTFAYADQSIDASESARVSVALDELVLRIAERSTLGQVLVTLRTLAIGGSCVFKIESLASPFLGSVILLCASLFTLTSVYKFKCSGSDTSCHLVCKNLRATPPAVVDALRALCASSARAAGVDLLQQAFAVAHEARAFLNPLRACVSLPADDHSGGDGGAGGAGGDLLLIAPRSPLAVLDELTRALPPLPSLFAAGMARRLDDGAFCALIEEMHDRLVADHTYFAYDVCRVADAAAAVAAADSSSVPASAAASVSPFLLQQRAECARADAQSRETQVRKLKEFELPVQKALVAAASQATAAAAAATTAAAAAAPAAPTSGVKRKEPSAGVTASASSASISSASSLAAARPTVVAPRSNLGARTVAVASASASGDAFEATDARPIALPPVQTVDLRAHDNPFFAALAAESARRGRVRARALRAIGATSESAGARGGRGGAPVEHAPVPLPPVHAVNLHAHENPFYAALMAEAARRECVRAK